MDRKADLSKTKVRDKYLHLIRQGEFDMIFISPPCATFSRATWANYQGPRPVRSFASPRGLETLTAKERDRAILGNIFADFLWEVAGLVALGQARFLAFEQPEPWGSDLGPTARAATGYNVAMATAWPAAAARATVRGLLPI